MGVIKKEIDSVNGSNFWNGINIYLSKPNAINKEVLQSETVCLLRSESDISEGECQSLHEKLEDFIIEQGKSVCDAVIDICNDHDFAHISSCDNLNSITIGANYFMIKRIIPKKTFYTDNKFYELCFLDTLRNTVRLYTIFDKTPESSPSTPDKSKHVAYDPYVIVKFGKIVIQFDGKCISVDHEDGLSEKGINWIKSIFVTKLTKLIKSDNVNPCGKSMALDFTSQIDVVKYYKLYEAMKSKYAKELIDVRVSAFPNAIPSAASLFLPDFSFTFQNWSENTDPHKFVFEDIGIASYLMLLWNNGDLPSDGSKKQRFMDLGCGNGLLVYILNSEGHHGIGLDIRKRKIWDAYPPHVVLKEETVIPGPSSVYPDADWLIGNHSDELTPWLPIMARRSSPTCEYFVLPCCPYRLNGRVYQRKNSGMSVYHDFIHHVREISQMCQFDTSIDKLRIPSTKRICIIGRGKPMSVSEMASVHERIDEFIGRETQGGSGDKWATEFEPRPSVEAVRNCTRLPKEVTSRVVRTIASALLSRINNVTVEKGGAAEVWNQGGSLPLCELADLLGRDELKVMKKECKGLQTLIKNHHYVFRVSGGRVRLRSPEEISDISRKVLATGNGYKWKETLCWFRYNHPDGCPLSDECCSYRH